MMWLSCFTAAEQRGSVTLSITQVDFSAADLRAAAERVMNSVGRHHASQRSRSPILLVRIVLGGYTRTTAQR